MDWSSFWGAFVGTLLNLVEIGLLVGMLKQFKKEGKDDEWLK